MKPEKEIGLIENRLAENFLEIQSLEMKRVKISKDLIQNKTPLWSRLLSWRRQKEIFLLLEKCLITAELKDHNDYQEFLWGQIVFTLTHIEKRES